MDNEHAKRRPGRGYVYLWPLALLVGGFALAVQAARWEHQADEARTRDALRAELEPMASALSRELFAAIHATEGIAALIAVEGGISEERFRAFVGELFRRSELIHNVAVAPDNVVAFVHPLAGNERAVGLDYARHPAQWPSVERMMVSRRMVVAGPVALVQGGVGVIGRTPIYVENSGGGPRRYWGLTSTVVKFDALLAKTPLSGAKGRLDLALRGADGLGAKGALFWGERRVLDAAPVAVDVPLPTGAWQLAATPRGGWKPFRPGASPYLLGGGLLTAALAFLLLGLLRARAELEQRVEVRTLELRSARDAAESADRMKSAFLATMSHELRTPLNSVIGFSGVLLQGLAGPLTEEQRKQLGMVLGSAQHLLALINDVLDLSKIEAGQLRLQLEDVDLRAAVEQSVATVRPQAEKKGLALEVQVASDLAPVRADRRRLEQVLLNLLSNALKFTERGAVEVRAVQTGGRVKVTVRDTGPGIKPEDLPRLFKPFSQLESGLDKRHEGTGLGLSICRRLVELMGGAIWVQSEWGRGSTFGIEFPLVAPTAAARLG